ncbi:acyl-CoA dehydrogenase, C-terminal domain protein [Leptospira ryugenii]|uniref:Acyl-CoA dehydrogenase, C-terminal domain protein n=1 Tax=Leptospira ryugenii TaxID=1917863 RepID=A0A2P2DYH6_9LEPT|nr:acyl-CoA dehydrogenase [Leptospira ryugenii]GBF49672.1 acyl-CoA dehydrogenase, C-terminal domain protein [Leptospira ryugenii]
MQILNPKKTDYSHLDEKTQHILKSTIQFFETKGKQKLKSDDHSYRWYDDFIEHLKKENIFGQLLAPPAFGTEGSRFDNYRNCYFNEILGFYGLSYWYVWQVSILGLGPIWNSQNEKVKNETKEDLLKGGVFGFGLSEKEHGADLISSDMMLYPQKDGTYLAKGSKYYIGNGNVASRLSVFGKNAETGKFVFFAVRTNHPKYELKQNVVQSQKYVAEFQLNDYPITEEDILSKDRDAWDAALATVAYAKYNLGWASIGIASHAFHEALNHAANRRLFNDTVANFPHIKRLFIDAYARLIAMKAFAFRACDYMRAASKEDRRYLLFNPMVKMKVTMQAEEVINHLWDIIAAKGFEKDMYFEMATRDIRMLPKLEGTVHINMMLVNQFLNAYLFEKKPAKKVPHITAPQSDDFLFAQGATTKATRNVPLGDYEEIYGKFSTPNLNVFKSQIQSFVELVKTLSLSKEDQTDIDLMLSIGELLSLIIYGQLILEYSEFDSIDEDSLDAIFHVFVRDFSRYATDLAGKEKISEAHSKLCLGLVRKSIYDQEKIDTFYVNKILALKDTYRMNP